LGGVVQRLCSLSYLKKSRRLITGHYPSSLPHTTQPPIRRGRSTHHAPWAIGPKEDADVFGIGTVFEITVAILFGFLCLYQILCDELAGRDGGLRTNRRPAFRVLIAYFRASNLTLLMGNMVRDAKRVGT
jgi:hypothetical protein